MSVVATIPGARAVSRLRRVCLWIITGMSVAYLAAVMCAWLILQRADEWWPATILVFSPLWVLALPLAILLPLAALLRSWSVLVLLAAGVIVAGPVMGVNVPWAHLTGSEPPGPAVRVMTLNMHYSKWDPHPLEDLVASARPDIVAIQEWYGNNHSSLSKAEGWHINANPRLFLASRYAIVKAEELGKDSTSGQGSVSYYQLDTPAGLVHLYSLHTATARDGISDTLRDRKRGPDEVRANSALRREQCVFVAAQAAQYSGPVLVVGDFNTVPASTIFADVWGSYTDAFSAAGWGLGYTFYGAKTTVRIDHILAGSGWTCTSCRAGPFVGSPHRPVIADLVWTGQKP